MNHKVLVLDVIHQHGLEILSDFADVFFSPGITPDELAANIDQCHGIIVKSGAQLDAALLRRAKNLKVIGKAGSGLDNIDLKAAHQHGIKVVSSPQAGARSVAEYTVMAMLMLSKRMLEVQKMVMRGDFRRHLMQGKELGRMKVGLIGLGHIGIEVAELLSAFDCSLSAYDLDWANKSRFIQLGGQVEDNLYELLTRVDMASLHIPLTEETHHLFDRTLFAKAKRGLMLVNAARGAIIDSEALWEALASGKVAGAALDVIDPEPNLHLLPGSQAFQHILLGHEKVLYTPHIAAQTDETLARVTIDITHAVKKILTGNDA